MNELLIANAGGYMEDACRVEPFQRMIDVTTTGGEAETPVTVPGGKRLVIECVTILSQGNATVFLRTVASGVSVKHPVPPLSGLVRIYSNPGTSVFLRVERSGGGFSSVSASVAVSGHLVNV
jgi:hypothetical protein